MIGAGGAVLYRGSEEVLARARFLSSPHLTSNVCEYEGLLLAIEMAHSLGVVEVEIFGDSELVVRQVRGDYRARQDHLRALRDRAWRESARFQSVVIRESPRGRGGRRRDNNARADMLCRLAMDVRHDVYYGPMEASG